MAVDPATFALRHVIVFAQKGNVKPASLNREVFELLAALKLV